MDLASIIGTLGMKKENSHMVECQSMTGHQAHTHSDLCGVGVGTHMETRRMLYSTQTVTEAWSNPALNVKHRCGPALQCPS